MTITIPSGRTLPLQAKSGGGFASSALDLGGGGAPALSGGTSAFSYTIATLERDSEVTISTDGTYDFGQYGPELLILMDATEAAQADFGVGSNARLGPSVVLGNSSGTLPVESDALVAARLPGGAGWQIATKNPAGEENLNSQSVTGRIRVEHAASTRGFESRLLYAPDSRVQTMYKYLFSEELALPPDTDAQGFDWQVKNVWNMSLDGSRQGNDNSDLTDLFLTDLSTKLGRTTPFRDYTTMSSNDGFSTIFDDADVIRETSVPKTRTRDFVTRNTGASNEWQVPLDEPYQFEFSYDQGDPALTNDGQIECRVMSESIGEHLYARKTGVRLEPTTATLSTINYFTYPGYINGYNRDYDCHLSSAELYKTKGTGPNDEGAWARAAICDQADFTAATKITYLEPVQSAWSNTQAKFKLRGGWWALNDLSGKYLCLIGDDNQQIGTGMAL